MGGTGGGGSRPADLDLALFKDEPRDTSEARCDLAAELGSSVTWTGDARAGEDDNRGV